MRLGAYEDYIKEGGFESISAEMIAWYSVDGETPLSEDDIKELFNKTLYGGGHPKWCDYITHENLTEKDRLKMLRKGKEPKEMRNKNTPHPFYDRFLKDTQMITKIIWEANVELRNKICAGMPDDSNQSFSRCRNKLMSQFCGILENEITFRAYKYRVENGLCPAKCVDWGYDGFTTPAPPAHTDHAFHLNAMNEYVREKTGFTGVTIVEKEFKSYTIIQSVIDARREILVAVPATATEVAIVEVVQEAVEDGSQNEDYLAWKETFEKEWCKIINTACFIRTCYNADGTFQKYIIQTEKQLTTAYRHQSYTKVDERGKKKKTKCITEWLDDETMKKYDDADIYPPPLVCPSNVFNTWKPSPFHDNWDWRNEETKYEFDVEGVQMFCDHLKMLCKHEKDPYDYVSCWCAHMFQKPTEKSTQIIMISQEGSGKSLFLQVLGWLLGASKVLTTSSPERDVWGSFNSPMANAFLVNLNEVDKRNALNADGKIKELITDGTLHINSKGKDQFPIRSFHRFFTTTNGSDPARSHVGDRRNVIIRSSDERVGDFAYFANFEKRMSDPITLRSIYFTMMTTDLSNWNFRLIPRTEYHKTIIEGNRPPLEVFLENFTLKRMGENTVSLYGKDMLLLFRTWKDATGYAFDDKMNEATLLKRMLTELDLPVDTIVKLGRSGKGIQRKYDLTKLRKRFDIPEPGVCLLTANTILAEEEEVESECEEEEMEEEVVEKAQNPAVPEWARRTKGG